MQAAIRTVSSLTGQLALGTAVVIVCIAAGMTVAAVDDYGVSDATLYLLGASAIVALALILSSSIVCLVGLVALTLAGLSPEIAAVGGVEVTIADVFYAGLVGWCLVAVTGRVVAGRPVITRQPPFGQVFALAFLAYAGLSLWLSGDVSESPGESLVSWLRFVQTASIAWLAAIVIDSRRDVMWVLAAVVVGGVVLVGSVAVEATAGAGVAGRSGGFIGANAVGLVSGILLMAAVFAPFGRRLAYRIPLAAVAVAGLVLGKSVAAFVGTGLALALGLALAGRSTAAQRLVNTLIAVAVAGALVFAVVQFLRPSSVPTSGDFRESSASHRAIVGAAGLEIFERHPVFGVGWRNSSAPSIIGARDVNFEVRSRFPGAREIFYPDITPASVHNSYVQVLAELGVIGFGLLCALFTSIGVAIRRLMRRLPPGNTLRAPAWTMATGLLLIAIWLNDNPLYGGQVETVLPAVFVGALAAVARIVAREDDAQRAARDVARS